MTSREQQVLELIRQDPMLPQRAIAERLGTSRSAVAGHIMNLTNKGLIKGRGYVFSESPFVVVIGGANVDIHGRSTDQLRQADSNPGSVHTSAGGVARNIAENLSRLGVDCRLISAIGSDHNGKMLKRVSSDAGVNMQHVFETSSAQTSTYLSVLDDAGDMHVAVNDMSIIEQLTPERLAPHKAMLNQSSLLIVDCNLPVNSLAWLSNACDSTPLFADTVSVAKAARLKPHLHAVHTLKASASEVAALTGMPAGSEAQLGKAAAALLAAGVQRVFVTCGDRGVFISTNESQRMAPASSPGSNVVSTGGAGDAFLAGIAYSWLQDWGIDESVQFALAAADITLSSAATNNPTLSLETVRQAMETLRAE